MKSTMYRAINKIGLFALALTVLLLPSSQKAYACEECSAWAQDVYDEMQKHENWMVTEWWDKHLKVDMQKLTDTVRNAIMVNAMSFGMAMDGQNLMNSMRALEESNVETAKNYAPSESICKFGTLSRSLALSERKSRVAQTALAEKSQDRQLGHKNFASQDGSQGDLNARMARFKENFCDPADFASAMTAVCSASVGKSARQNNDVNFTRAVDAKKTIKVDFTDSTLTDDEEDVMALATNLYAHQVFDRINVTELARTNAEDSQSSYLNQRSIVAKRSVAENSFNVLVGQKSEGTDASRIYLLEVLKKLGLSATDAQKYVGTKPSYDVQMEVLTKKIYQDPAFYANLMDGPANVNRQLAALQSFGLMQRRDIYETILRSEMLLSVVLEMEISKYQTSLQNRSK